MLVTVNRILVFAVSSLLATSCAFSFSFCQPLASHADTVDAVVGTTPDNGDGLPIEVRDLTYRHIAPVHETPFTDPNYQTVKKYLDIWDSQGVHPFALYWYGVRASQIDQDSNAMQKFQIEMQSGFSSVDNPVHVAHMQLFRSTAKGRRHTIVKANPTVGANPYLDNSMSFAAQSQNMDHAFIVRPPIAGKTDAERDNLSSLGCFSIELPDMDHPEVRTFPDSTESYTLYPGTGLFMGLDENHQLVMMKVQNETDAMRATWCSEPRGLSVSIHSYAQPQLHWRSKGTSLIVEEVPKQWDEQYREDTTFFVDEPHQNAMNPVDAWIYENYPGYSMESAPTLLQGPVYYKDLVMGYTAEYILVAYRDEPVALLPYHAQDWNKFARIMEPGAYVDYRLDNPDIPGEYGIYSADGTLIKSWRPASIPQYWPALQPRQDLPEDVGATPTEPEPTESEPTEPKPTEPNPVNPKPTATPTGPTVPPRPTAVPPRPTSSAAPTASPSMSIPPAPNISIPAIPSIPPTASSQPSIGIPVVPSVPPRNTN